MFQKYKLKFNNRGYLQIDLAFGLFVFLILFVFVYNFYANYKSDLIEENQILELENDAQNICFMLVKSSGLPNNWEADINNSKFFGFKSVDSTQLDFNKINSFNNLTYFTIVDKINFSSNLAVKIDGIETNNNYLSFGVFANQINPKYANYQCFANYNSEIVKVFVEVWK